MGWGGVHAWPALAPTQPFTPHVRVALQINIEEWQFFLKGGVVLDRSQQVANPSTTWINEEAWDNITTLDELPNFKGIANSFDQNAGGARVGVGAPGPDPGGRRTH